MFEVQVETKDILAESRIKNLVSRAIFEEPLGAVTALALDRYCALMDLAAKSICSEFTERELCLIVEAIGPDCPASGIYECLEADVLYNAREGRRIEAWGVNATAFLPKVIRRSATDWFALADFARKVFASPGHLSVADVAREAGIKLRADPGQEG